MLKISKYDAALVLLMVFSTIYIKSGLPSITIIALQSLLLFKAVLSSTSKENSAKEIITAFLMPSEPALFLFFWIYLSRLVFQKSKPTNLASIKLAILLLYISLGLFLYNLISEGLILNYLIWLSTFFSGVAAYLYAKKDLLSANRINLLRFLGWCITMQISLLTGQAFYYSEFSPGDWATGSLGDAHKLGFWLLVAALFFWIKLVSCKEIKNAPLFVIFLLAFYLCDAKAMILSAAIALPIYLLVMCFLRRRTGNIFIFPHPAYGFFIVILTYSALLSLFNYEALNDFVELYVTGDVSNAKYVFLNRVWIGIFDDSLLNWLIGTGPGTLGSRAANILSSDVLYKLENSPLSSFSSSSFWTQKYMHGLWTEELATKIQYYSAVLAYPFSGISTMKAELGIGGLLVYISLIFSLSINLAIIASYRNPSPIDTARIALSFSLIVYAVAILFDNYQEQPGISYLLFFLSAIYSSSEPPNLLSSHKNIAMDEGVRKSTPRQFS